MTLSGEVANGKCQPNRGQATRPCHQLPAGVSGIGPDPSSGHQAVARHPLQIGQGLGLGRASRSDARLKAFYLILWVMKNH